MEKGKTKSKKWIIAIVLIAIIVIALGLYFNVFSIPTGLIAGEITTEETSEETTQPSFTITGSEVIAKETTETLPYYESVNLEDGRYAIEFVSDEPVLVFVFEETRFNEWKNEGGKYTVVAGTGRVNKVTSYADTFDVNKGQGGLYYIVVEGAEEASIKFKITQILKF